LIESILRAKAAAPGNRRHFQNTVKSISNAGG
jgi:hypothetical protein